MNQPITRQEVVGLCPKCETARQLARDLDSYLGVDCGLGVVGKPCSYENRPLQPEPLRVMRLQVTCDACHGSGVVLTEAGRAVAELLAGAGLVSSAEVEAWLAKTPEPRNPVPAEIPF